MNAVMMEKMAQMIMNLHQPNLAQNNTGINHIPNKVAICSRNTNEHFT